MPVEVGDGLYSTLHPGRMTEARNTPEDCKAGKIDSQGPSGTRSKTLHNRDYMFPAFPPHAARWWRTCSVTVPTGLAIGHVCQKPGQLSSNPETVQELPASVPWALHL